MNLYQDLDTVRSALSLGASNTDEDADILRIVEAVSREADGFCGIGGRSAAGMDGFGFFPRTESRLIELSRTSRWRELRAPKLLGLTSLKVDGAGDDTYTTSLTELTDFVLEPRSGLPKSAVRFLADSGQAFYQGSGSSLGVAEITAEWGEYSELISGGTTAEALDSSELGIDLTGGHLVTAGRTILIGTEQIYVASVSTNTATVERGVNGTTAAAHLTGATVSIYRYPRPVEDAVLMQSLRLLARRSTSFASVTVNPDLGQVEIFKGLDEDVKDMLRRYIDPVADFA